MAVAQKLGIIIFSGVPAIIGGGIIYALFGHTAAPVVIYELILACTVTYIITKK
jgi:hypothetical protein